MDSLNGIAYLAKSHAFQPTVHWHGTHSAPFFLSQAIMSSRYYTTVPPTSISVACSAM